MKKRKISDEVKSDCVGNATAYPNSIASILKTESAAESIKVCSPRCVNPRRVPKSITFGENYLLEKGCPEPTDEEYAEIVEIEN